MRTLALLLILAAPAVATQPCHQAFCRVQKVAVVHRQQSYGHQVYASAYYVPYQQQTAGSFADQSDILKLAIREGVGEALDERGIGNRPLALAAGVDLAKCIRCHGSASTKAAARDAYKMPDDATIQDAAVASKVMKGLRAGMAGADYANLTEQQQQAWFEAITDSIDSHFTGE